ncbi:hypothetical protein [Marinithermofilum abyssi]|uniref:hypothetical protein n=1 Tax=Marinithermofilum abyssi TaxID=1571185 RepID=UPI00166B555F|nr:hypothetical protein [Marinithermofilum abyssi]
MVKCIAPWLILAEGSEEVLVPTPTIKKELERNIPVGRLGMPEDLLYLGTEASSYATGETIKVLGEGTGRI